MIVKRDCCTKYQVSLVIFGQFEILKKKKKKKKKNCKIPKHYEHDCRLNISDTKICSCFMFSVLETQYPFGANLTKKIIDYSFLFSLKFGTNTNLNRNSSMVIFTFSIF